MRNHRPRTIWLFALLLAALPGPGAAAEREATVERPAFLGPRCAPPFLLPCRFEPNLGQARPGVDVIGRAAGLLALLSRDGVARVADGGAAAGRLRFAGGSAKEPWRPVDPAAGRSRHFRGSGDALRVLDAPRFLGAILPDAWPGVEASFRAEGTGLAYGFRLAPGADGESLRFSFEGADGVDVEDGGGLRVLSPRGVFRHSPPVAWQESGRRRLPVEARFARTGERSARIVLGATDPRLPVVVDPRIDFLSAGGGSGDETASWIDLDNSVLGSGHLVAAGPDGNLTMAGMTASTDFPAVGTFPSAAAGNVDIFVARLDGITHEVLWTAFLGSSNNDVANAVAVDGDGRAVVAGRCLGAGGFPVTAGTLQFFPASTADGLLFRIAADGSSLDFSTYYGGSSGAEPFALAIGPDGDIVMAGSTWSGGFSSTSIPLKDPLQNQNMGSQDVFVARVLEDGTGLLWATYWGGGKHDVGCDVAFDEDGGVVVAGMTQSTNFPVAGTPLQVGLSGGYDVFLARFAGNGTSCTFSTYLGGTLDDAAAAVAPGPDGAVFVGGSTKSSAFPLKNPLQSVLGGTEDAFLARVDATGSSLALGWSTLLGGAAEDRIFGVALMGNGKVVAAGETLSDGFPATSGAIQAERAGGRDGFVARFDPSGASMDYATFLGGSSTDRLRGLAVSEGIYAVVGGATEKADMAPATGGFGTSGGIEAWIGSLTWVPKSPVSLSATPVTSSSVDLAWSDRADDETGFTIERARVGQPWFAIATVPANTQAWRDGGTLGDADYLYRVRADNDDGPSRWSGEAAVTTPPGPPGPPLPPGDPVLSVLSPTSVRVDWEDRSDSEAFFQVSRRQGSGEWSTLATPSAEVHTWTDRGLLAGRAYTYTVRAGNAGGISPPSGTASVTLPTTLEAALVKGLLKDSPKPGKDRLKVSGTLALGEGAAAPGLDPTGAAVEFRFGGWEGLALLRIPAGDEGWRSKKGKWTWKSPKDSLTKASLVLDPATGAFTLSLSKFTLAVPPANPIVLSIGFASEGGSLSADWLPKNTTWRY